jgi:hypothetical protein
MQHKSLKRKSVQGSQPPIVSSQRKAHIGGGSLKEIKEDRLEKAEKHLHKGCGTLERILVRIVIFGFFLYGLWRVAEAFFRLHP